jgi:signal peptidase I
MTATQHSSEPVALWQIILIGRNPQFTLVRIAIWVVALLLISKFLFLPVRVDGVSMLPTYKDNRVNLVNRLAYLFHEPRRGDVVAIRLAGEHMMYLKRIVALPGESVGFANGRAMINGAALSEPYVRLPCDWNRAPVTLGPGEYFVVGDNRSMPQHDHRFGRARRTRIMGRTIF